MQRRVRRILGPDPDYLVRYRAEYEAAFEARPAPSSKAELVEAVAAADVAFCGDYHTLLQAQKTSLKILREVVPRRRVTLGLEAFRARDQRHLDAYLAGDLGEADFLAATRYQARWGFAWSRYRMFFDFARAHGLRVLGLDHKPPARDPGRLLKRDAFAAQVLARAHFEDPAALLWVVFGDLHVAPAHLPAQLEEILARRGRAARTVVVFQNNKHLYFRLAERGELLERDTVKLGPGRFCVLNTPPWVKLRSYLDHLETQVFPAYDDDEEIEEGEHPGYEDFLLQLIRELGRVLEVEVGDLSDFRFYTRAHVAALGDGVFVPGPPGTLARLLESAKAFYFPRERAILLLAFDSNHAAEAAGEYLHHRVSGYRMAGRDARDTFYLGAVRKTFGFFASQLMNPKRKTDYFKDHDIFLRRWRRRPLRGPRARQRAVSRLVVQHQRAMERVLAGAGRRPRLRKVYAEDPGLGFGVSRALGTIMGDKLFRGLMGGRVSKAELRDWLGRPLARPGEPYELYRDLRRRLKAVKKPYKSKDEFF